MGLKSLRLRLNYDLSQSGEAAVWINIIPLLRHLHPRELSGRSGWIILNDESVMILEASTEVPSNQSDYEVQTIHGDSHDVVKCKHQDAMVPYRTLPLP